MHSDQSKVNFKRYGVVVNKFGAKGAHESQATVEINPDLIKVFFIACFSNKEE